METTDFTKTEAISLLTHKWSNVQCKGEGGNGWVFRVEENQDVLAVKVLKDFNRYHRFQEEVRAARNLAGLSGILPIRQANLPKKPSTLSLESLPYYSMPFCSGGSLKIPRDATSEGTEAVNLLLEISQIIAGVHARGYAHRDLKPGNILKDSSGCLWVSDYGLYIDLEKKPNGRITRIIEIVGAYNYRAPEYLRGRLDASDHRPGDIFSLGRLLWVFLMGKEPENLTDIEFSAIRPSQNVPNLRRATLLDLLIADCTQADPTRRPEINDVINVLEEWKRNIPEHSFEGFSKRILESEETYLMRQNQQRQQAVLDAITDATRAVGEILENHPYTQKLRQIGSRPDQPEIGGNGWWTDTCKVATMPNPTYTSGIRFNLGNLKLAPLVGFQFGFAIKPGSSTIVGQVVGGAIHEVNSEIDSWPPKDFQFERFDSSARATVERLIDEGFAFMLNELGIGEDQDKT